MKKDPEPWHELIYVCPKCLRQFKPVELSLHVRLCPDCEKEYRRHDDVIQDMAMDIGKGRARRTGLSGGIVTDQ